MANINARKVLEMGGGTLLVSIPKDWARRNGVQKGATLAVEEISGSKLMIRPIEHRGEEGRGISIGYPGEGPGSVANEVTGAYLLGYDTIRVEAKSVIGREDRAMLKGTVNRLVGLEIVDEDSKKMTLQFLLEPTAFVPEKIVRRISGLLDGMLRDTAEALSKRDQKLMALVGERDDEVDRLYFLLVRATRAAIVRPEVAEGYGLTQVDLLDYRVLASFLESVGDAVTSLSKNLNEASLPKQLSKQYASCVVKLKEMNELATMAFITRKASRQRPLTTKLAQTAAEVSETLAQISRDPVEKGSDFAETIASLDRVEKLLVDISDLAVAAQPLG
ncbi:MAG TPA: phosphate uptake regulator PhoU [Nitrososphaerales archaeon]|nr:phosphate uptake regulator PhoU [Nitrososphaerales archaeon]